MCVSASVCLTEKETREPGTFAMRSFDCWHFEAGVNVCCPVQSTEQSCRELEAADVASVARLVRGSWHASAFGMRELLVFVVLMSWLSLWWVAQALAGLGELRTPAVRNMMRAFWGGLAATPISTVPPNNGAI